MTSDKLFSFFLIVVYLLTLFYFPIWGLCTYPFIGGMVWFLSVMLREPLSPWICLTWFPKLIKNLTKVV